VYVYGRRESVWELEARLEVGGDFDDLRSLDVSGDTLVVGDLTYRLDPTVGWRGAVHVFARANGTWSYADTITVDPPDSNFGWSVSIDGDTLAVGQPYRDGDGVVRVFRRDDRGVWAETAILRGPLDYGYEVALDDDTLAITGPSHSSVGLGHVDIHTRGEAGWTWEATVYARDHGYEDPVAPALSGDVLLLAGDHEHGSLADALSRRDQSWSLGARLATDGPATRLRFATAVHGETAVLGRPWDDREAEGAGSATVYRLRCRLPVMVDIRPGSEDNPIVPGGPGRIPVAILGTHDFDVTTVDSSTLRFGPGGAVPIHEGGHLEDVDRDGLVDLLQHYRAEDAAIPCGAESATVTGETFDGCRIEGTDTVETAGACP
jgi:hypothetical protein